MAYPLLGCHKSHLRLRVSPEKSLSYKCYVLIKASLCISGQPYPVHPLDLSTPETFTYTENGVERNVTACVNSYRRLALDPTTFAGFDAILGDAFLRNVYASSVSSLPSSYFSKMAADRIGVIASITVISIQ